MIYSCFAPCAQLEPTSSVVFWLLNYSTILYVWHIFPIQFGAIYTSYKKKNTSNQVNPKVPDLSMHFIKPNSTFSIGAAIRPYEQVGESKRRAVVPSGGDMKNCTTLLFLFFLFFLFFFLLFFCVKKIKWWLLQSKYSSQTHEKKAHRASTSSLPRSQNKRVTSRDSAGSPSWRECTSICSGGLFPTRIKMCVCAGGFMRHPIFTMSAWHHSNNRIIIYIYNCQ